MNSKTIFGAFGGFVAVFSLSQIACAQQADPHGWLGTETFKTRFGDFQFKDGYPVGDTARRLLDRLRYRLPRSEGRRSDGY